jgi:hypothetical protein
LIREDYLFHLYVLVKIRISEIEYIMYSILLISGDRYSPDTLHRWRNFLRNNFYEINGNVNDRILIILELLKRTKVEAVVPDCMAK